MIVEGVREGGREIISVVNSGLSHGLKIVVILEYVKSVFLNRRSPEH